MQRCEDAERWWGLGSCPGAEYVERGENKTEGGEVTMMGRERRGSRNRQTAKQLVGVTIAWWVAPGSHIKQGCGTAGLEWEAKESWSAYLSWASVQRKRGPSAACCGQCE